MGTPEDRERRKEARKQLIEVLFQAGSEVK